jgi:hypothetical protein
MFRYLPFLLPLFFITCTKVVPFDFPYQEKPFLSNCINDTQNTHQSYLNSVIYPAEAVPPKSAPN